MSDTGVLSTFRAVLARELPAVFSATCDQLDRLTFHFELMLRWNQRLNLTRVTAVEDAVRKHYCEAAVVASLLPSGPLKVADVGSGAGFPGLPVAILRPDLEVTLIESHQRKAVFLREASRDLSNVAVAAVRSETFAEGSFAWSVSRAVRFEDVLGGKLAPNVALLLAEADCARVVNVKGFCWKIVRPDRADGALCVAVGTGTTP